MPTTLEKCARTHIGGVGASCISISQRFPVYVGRPRASHRVLAVDLVSLDQPPLSLSCGFMCNTFAAL